MVPGDLIQKHLPVVPLEILEGILPHLLLKQRKQHLVLYKLNIKECLALGKLFLFLDFVIKV